MIKTLFPLSPLSLEFRRRGGGSFDIASTNPSAYYDRTNLATLFQNAAGSTHVTGAAQPIWLGLDQSQGLVIGADIVTNGDFSAGSTGWIAPGGVISGGKLACSGASGYIAYSNQGISAFKYYEVSFEISGYVSGEVRAYLGVAATYTPLYSSDGVHTARILTGSATEIGIQSPTSFTGSIDNISVRLVAGNHQYQTSASYIPITAGSPIYADFDAVDDALTATFAASLGSGCTVCRSLPGTGADITTGVTLTDTYTDNVDAHALLIYTAAQWAALDAGQIANITTWLNGRAGL